MPPRFRCLLHYGHPPQTVAAVKDWHPTSSPRRTNASTLPPAITVAGPATCRGTTLAAVAVRTAGTGQAEGIGRGAGALRPMQRVLRAPRGSEPDHAQTQTQLGIDLQTCIEIRCSACYGHHAGPSLIVRIGRRWEQRAFARARVCVCVSVCMFLLVRVCVRARVGAREKERVRTRVRACMGWCIRGERGGEGPVSESARERVSVGEGVRACVRVASRA